MSSAWHWDSKKLEIFNKNCNKELNHVRTMQKQRRVKSMSKSRLSLVNNREKLTLALAHQEPYLEKRKERLSIQNKKKKDIERESLKTPMRTLRKEYKHESKRLEPFYKLKNRPQSACSSRFKSTQSSPRKSSKHQYERPSSARPRKTQHDHQKKHEKSQYRRSKSRMASNSERMKSLRRLLTPGVSMSRRERRKSTQKNAKFLKDVDSFLIEQSLKQHYKDTRRGLHSTLAIV